MSSNNNDLQRIEGKRHCLCVSGMFEHPYKHRRNTDEEMEISLFLFYATTRL